MLAPLTFRAATIPLWLVAPFGLLLFLIAVMPLTPAGLKKFWDHYYPHVSLGLAGVIAAYYAVRVPDGFAALGFTIRDYFGFIALVGSLFVVAGGIHLHVKGESTPGVNIIFLAIGACLANVIGTTGASMVLIRPWIRMNKLRASAYHVVFFIFLISNVGGALTPVGDPPLFLGYLRGVPFFWLISAVLPQWLATVGLILVAFYFFDRRSFNRMPGRLQSAVETQPETWRFEGALNVVFLAGIVGAVFLPDFFLLREIVMVGIALASWRFTPAVIHAENHFSFGPIKEVALLFAGIFVTMLPALDYLQAHGASFGIIRPLHYYFASGALSSVLDNAPTYANFLALAQSTAGAAIPGAFAQAATPAAQTAVLLQERSALVVAVSLGSVFFGAMTYIGNGPNFMVKAIAHEAGVHCPTFFGYVAKYSLPILLPILALTGWWFL